MKSTLNRTGYARAQTSKADPETLYRGVGRYGVAHMLLVESAGPRV